MAIPKKGSRSIHVDGVDYRWLIRRKPAYAQSYLHIAIEAKNNPGATLLIQSERPHPEHWDTEEIIPVTPSDIEGWINSAIEAGWEPGVPGSTIVITEPGNERA